MSGAQDEDLDFLLCPTHGKLPWRGEMVCSDCGRLWLPRFEGAGLPEEVIVHPPNAPLCECGAQFLPDETHRVDVCTAMPVCTRCYETHKPRLYVQQGFFGPDVN